MTGHQTRKCIGCGERARKADLLRVVWNGSGLQPDAGQTFQSRGAYVHRAGGCIGRALDGKRWERALRLKPGQLSKEAAAALQEWMAGGAAAEDELKKDEACVPKRIKVRL